MPRLPGFLFSYPGMYSITVPYHDTNDFYYSGHIGTCFLITLEFRAYKFYKMSYFTFFILANQWIMMMMVRTHYIIDMVTGLIVAHYMFIWAEKLCYFVDVKLMRIPSRLRGRTNFKPCSHCGWSNLCASDYMDDQEEKTLRELYKEQ